MQKEKDRNLEPMFPAPFEYFEDLITNDLRLRKDLGDELQRLRHNYQPPKTYQLNFHPPGLPQGNQSKNFCFAEEKLQNQIKEAGYRIVERLDRECKELELKKEQVKEINKIVYENMFPDPYNGLGPSEKKAYSNKSKDLEEAERSMYYLRKRAGIEKQNMTTKSKEDYSPDKE